MPESDIDMRKRGLNTFREDLPDSSRCSSCWYFVPSTETANGDYDKYGEGRCKLLRLDIENPAQSECELWASEDPEDRSYALRVAGA